jgi:hypothetical protein
MSVHERTIEVMFERVTNVKSQFDIESFELVTPDLVLLNKERLILFDDFNEFKEVSIRELNEDVRRLVTEMTTGI